MYLQSCTCIHGQFCTRYLTLIYLTRRTVPSKCHNSSYFRPSHCLLESALRSPRRWRGPCQVSSSWELRGWVARSCRRTPGSCGEDHSCQLRSARDREPPGGGRYKHVLLVTLPLDVLTKLCHFIRVQGKVLV